MILLRKEFILTDTVERLINLIAHFRAALVIEPKLVKEEKRIIELAKQGLLGPPDFAEACDLFYELPRDYLYRKQHAYVLTMIEPGWMLPEERVFEL